MPKKSGFTLIELLVVISIIGVLSAIGSAVYSRVQAKARDAKRIADIDVITKSLETSKDFTTGIYTNKLDTDFPSNSIPTDPTSTRSYCICAGSSFGTDYSFQAWQQLSNPPYSLVRDGCLTAGCRGMDPWVKVSSNPFPDNTRFWSICAVKEAVDQVYCKHSLGN